MKRTKVTLIEMRVQKILINVTSTTSLIVLVSVKDEGELLPIEIGNYGAQAIVQIIQRVKYYRPLTHDLIDNIINTLQGKLSDVIIDNIGEEELLATIHIMNKWKAIAIESRACDAIGLALKSNAPIYTTRRLLSRFSDVKDKLDINTEQGFMEWLNNIDSCDHKHKNKKRRF